jgi:3-oxoacyl-[acyl-carrier protein] reductase
MDLGLKGRVAFVAAASRGLGRAVAEELAAEGARVALCARSERDVEAAAAEIAAATGAETLPLRGDVASPADVAAMAREIERRAGRIDILITNAGGPPAGPFEAHAPEAWNGAVALDFLSAVTLCREVVPLMKAARWGRIVAITSVAVKQPIEGLILSNSVRAAVAGFAKTLSAELAPYNILVNTVCPGYTRTARVEAIASAEAARTGRTVEEIRRKWESQIPLGRMGEPRELAALIAFLVSERASYITGTTIAVDGGFCRSLL